jgi:Mn-containing catalase
MTREITHMKAFMAALESLGKPALSIGNIPPTPELVKQYFNDSTGEGDEGGQDARSPWNEGDDWEFVEAPAFREFASGELGTREADSANGDAKKPASSERHSRGTMKSGSSKK